MEPKFNYIALLVVIIVGVTAGNLISAWLTTENVEEKSEKASVENSKSVTATDKNTEKEQKSEPQAEPAIADRPEDQEQLMKQRKYDPNGARLAKTCNEWRKAHEDMNNQTTRIESTKHCDIYEKYIKTGILPTLN